MKNEVKRKNRKRKPVTNKQKTEIVSNEEPKKYAADETETGESSEVKKPRTEEELFAEDLFGDNSGFLKSLEDVQLFSSSPTDSGFAETETEDNSIDNENEKKRKPAWHDPDDDGIDVGKALDAQNRKLPSGGLCDRSGQYSNLLKHKFKSLVGTPKWASLDKIPSGRDDSDDELLQTCGHLVGSKSPSLPPSTIEFKKVEDVNKETYNEGPKITSVQFHPSSTVALVAGMSGVASIFAVDGNRNNKLSSVTFTKYPIKCARFLNNGLEALFGSNLSHFISYDLMGGKTIRIPLPHSMTQCKSFEISPCNKIIAVCGKWGQIHLLCSITRELITTLKQNNAVTAIAFNNSRSLLFGHSDCGEVTVWDMRKSRMKHKFVDEGCLDGTTLSISKSGQLIACGSAQGVVNVYDMQNVLKEQNPKPRKSIMNLTTRIDDLKFNCTSEILGFCSSELGNSVRLLHVGSGNVFSNFPTFTLKLGLVNTLSFSPGGGYAAFANKNSTVSLYRLKHYKNY